MDEAQLRPATPQECRLVEQGRTTFSKWFNSVPNVTPHEFIGAPSDIGLADWVFYELGGALWDRDHGYCLTCTWGNVLVQSFGFQWYVMGAPRDFRDYLLHHPVGYQFFSWQRLWESVLNPGGHSRPTETVWLNIMTDVELFRNLPDGWYPAIDAIRGKPLGWPAETIRLLEKRLDRRPDTFFEELGLWPYEWNVQSDWKQILGWLSLNG